MWALLLVLIVVLFLLRKTRERFGLVFGTGKWGFTTNTDTEEGREVFSMYPFTCTAPKADLQAGLCYEKCRAGYFGVGPLCLAKTEDVGIGKPIGLEPCPDGWANDGLTCREPIRCASGWDFFSEGCSGGNVIGRLDNGGICDWPKNPDKLPDHLKETVRVRDPLSKRMVNKVVASHPDRIDGLCYRKCPKELPKHVPAMPYLCYRGGDLTYSRGIGSIPPPLRIGRTWGFPWSNY